MPCREEREALGALAAEHLGPEHGRGLGLLDCGDTAGHVIHHVERGRLDAEHLRRPVERPHRGDRRGGPQAARGVELEELARPLQLVDARGAGGLVDGAEDLEDDVVGAGRRQELGPRAVVEGSRRADGAVGAVLVDGELLPDVGRAELLERHAREQRAGRRARPAGAA